MNICIIAIAKRENPYILEWINHHLNMGVSHIYICDNNDPDDNSLPELVNDDRVTIVDYRGVQNVQPLAYTESFLKFREGYDWITFIDVDEFIQLDDKYSCIQDFLSEEMFQRVDIIRLHWKVFSGGKKLEANGDYNVLNRFNKRFPCFEEKWVKSIIRGNIEWVGGKVFGHGYFRNKNLKVVNALGKPAFNIWATGGDVPIHENAWINHYPTKTIGEFIDQKYFRGGSNLNDGTYSNLRYFFRFNPENKSLRKYGEEKIERIKKERGIN